MLSLEPDYMGCQLCEDIELEAGKMRQKAIDLDSY